jgi:EpsI family protein
MSNSSRFLITASLLGCASGGLALSLRRNPDYLAAPLSMIGSEIAGWKQTGTQPIGQSALKRLLPTDYLSRTYRKDHRDLGLFIAFYAQQRSGESMHSPRHCLPGSGWEIWKYDSAEVPGRDGAVKVNRFFIQNGGKRMVVYYWYQSRGRIVASEYLGKLLLIRDTLVDGRTAGAIVRIVVDDVPEAYQDGVEFASAVMPLVARCFRQ